jgi:hypothetical protein
MTLTLAVMLVVAQTDAGSSPTVWALGSTVNLREKPDAKGKLLATASIGTSCTRLRAQGEWLEVACPFGSGFAKAELFGDKAPTAAELRAAFEDGQRPVAERLQAAQRLAALDKADAIDQFTYKELFEKGQLERLRTLLEKRKKPVDTISLRFGPDVSDHQTAMHTRSTRAPPPPSRTSTGRGTSPSCTTWRATASFASCCARASSRTECSTACSCGTTASCRST